MDGRRYLRVRGVRKPRLFIVRFELEIRVPQLLRKAASDKLKGRIRNKISAAQRTLRGAYFILFDYVIFLF